MHDPSTPHRRRGRTVGVLTLLVASLAFAVPQAGASLPAGETARDGQRTARQTSVAKPTIVLVHGAFADASGWNDVIARLQKRGYTTYAPANPLRGLTSDSEYLRSFLNAIKGPIVLVGHSYGGAVITNAARGNPKVKSLVYVAAYALDQGETVQAANSLGGGHTDLLDHLVLRPFPGAAPGDQDAYVDPAYFRSIFAQDLPKRQTAVMAAGQRPGALSALVTPSGVPAWKTTKSWYLVAHDDHLIPPVAQRVMAKRAHARTFEIRSSHVAMMSHPGTVTALVLAAVHQR